MKEVFLKLPSHLAKDLRRIRLPLFLAVLYFAGTKVLFGETCPFRLLTGFPCPGCGLTRAGLLVISGHWDTAAKMNLSIFLWIPYLVYLFFAQYFFPRLKDFAMVLLIIVCIFTIVYYIVRLALLLSGETYIYQNLFLYTDKQGIFL